MLGHNAVRTKLCVHRAHSCTPCWTLPRAGSVTNGVYKQAQATWHGDQTPPVANRRHVTTLTETHAGPRSFYASTSSPPGALRLQHAGLPTGPTDKLLVYLPGTDGTGQSILPQLDGLYAAGYDVYCLAMPADNRAGWDALARQTSNLLRRLLDMQAQARSSAQAAAGEASGDGSAGSRSEDGQQGTAPAQKVLLVGESFGGALALRVALTSPELVDRLVLLNPATSFNASLGGVSSFITATNLLGLFPDALYAVAQATLLPLLVDSARLGPNGMDLMRAMIEMRAVDDVVAPAPDSTREGRSSPPSGISLPALPLPLPLPLALPEQLPPLTMDPSPAAAAANWRTNLLRTGDLAPEQYVRILQPVLLLISARDRLLPSLQEGARLLRLLPNATRTILPDSGHAALLEKDISLAALLSAWRPTSRGIAISSRSSCSDGSVGGGSDGVGVGMAARVGGPVASRAAAEPQVTAAAHLSSEASVTLAATASSASARPRPATPTDASRTASSNAGTRPSPQKGGKEAGKPVRDDASFDEWGQILAPWRDLVSPVVLGADCLPPPGSHLFGRPMLFVGNHQLIGFYDTPLLVYELAMRGYRVRGLAHPGHWSGPVGPFFERFGAVKASPMAAFRLLRANEKVLLFPGGAREVVKPRSSQYTLLWKEEPDFVRLAAKAGALIVPFAAVGADDAYDVMMDTNELLDHPVLGPIASRLASAFDPTLDPHETVMPLTRLPGPLKVPSPIPIPRLNRLYFKFATPIDTAPLARSLRDPAAAVELYSDVRHTVEQCMADLLAYRAQDADADLGTRLRATLDRWAPLMRAAAATSTREGGEGGGHGQH